METSLCNSELLLFKPKAQMKLILISTIRILQLNSTCPLIVSQIKSKGNKNTIKFTPEAEELRKSFIKAQNIFLLSWKEVSKKVTSQSKKEYDLRFRELGQEDTKHLIPK